MPPSPAGGPSPALGINTRGAPRCGSTTQRNARGLGLPLGVTPNECPAKGREARKAPRPPRTQKNFRRSKGEMDAYRRTRAERGSDGQPLSTPLWHVDKDCACIRDYWLSHEKRMDPREIQMRRVESVRDIAPPALCALCGLQRQIDPRGAPLLAAKAVGASMPKALGA
jgi:hypothetical protein